MELLDQIYPDYNFRNTSSNNTNQETFLDISNNDLIGTSVIGILLSLMCVAGVVGNFYTLVVICISVTTFTSMYIHILNLALADLLYLSTIPFIVHNSFVKDWYFGEAGCRVLLSLDLLTMHASIFILTVMSTERYIAVSKPFNTVRGSKRYRKSLAFAIWVLSFLLTLPMMLMIHQEERILDNGTVRNLCTPTWSDEQYKIYLTVLFTTSILAPGVIIGYLYTKLARAYWISQTKSLLNKELPRSPKQKVILMIFIIVLAFWACFLPFWIWQLVPLYSNEELRLSVQTEIYVNTLVTCLTYGNSCINPFLYTLLSRNYKEYLRNRQRGGLGSLSLKGGTGYPDNPAKRSLSGGSNQGTETVTLSNAKLAVKTQHSV
ncbi:urotensin-2 receptor-like [Rana temporaria]|uniref:urotensin-2 receptor-like n=1 Tax=Rana temporaria TaxID=8407 RepID=UPI001AAC85C2|nr:urotensin-2 receptor-like [Rana temporaria]XP_040181521.1 urotensin-2 receptor-like [Rana temporaria]